MRGKPRCQRSLLGECPFAQRRGTRTGCLIDRAAFARAADASAAAPASAAAVAITMVIWRPTGDGGHPPTIVTGACRVNCGPSNDSGSTEVRRASRVENPVEVEVAEPSDGAFRRHTLTFGSECCRGCVLVRSVDLQEKGARARPLTIVPGSVHPMSRRTRLLSTPTANCKRFGEQSYLNRARRAWRSVTTARLRSAPRDDRRSPNDHFPLEAASGYVRCQHSRSS